MEEHMEKDVAKITSEIDLITADVQQKFGGLSGEQLNWKPAAESWSIGQCIDHLIKTNEIYSEDFKAVANGTRSQSAWERWSPFSGFFGRFLTNIMPKDQKKVKTTGRFVPPSEIDADVVKRFAKSQEELKDTVRSTEKADWDKTILTSSFMGLVTYSLGDAYNIVTGHQHRHIRQAERVVLEHEFPK
jgi:hypothetical protein